MLETVRSLGRRRLEPREAHDDALLIRHLPYVTALTDDVLMLRDGEIMATFAVDGIAAATAESVLVDDVADAVQTVVAQATPDLGFYLHRVSFVTDARLAAPLDADPFSFEVDRRWQAALAAMELRERRSFLSVVLRPQKILGLSTRLFGAGVATQRNLLSRRVERLNEAVSYLMETLAVAGPERLTVGDGRWLGLLRTFVTGRFEFRRRQRHCRHGSRPPRRAGEGARRRERQLGAGELARRPGLLEGDCLMRWLWIALAAAALAGCAGYTDKTSPCVCNWTPVSGGVVPA